jgi:hypothetical protein
MRDLIRKVLNEHPFTPIESNELDSGIKEFLFNYWEKNGTELTPFKYLNIDPLGQSDEVDILKIEFHGGFDNAMKLAEEEIGIGKKIHLSSGGYEFDFTPKSFGVIHTNDRYPEGSPQHKELGMSGVISDGSVRLLNTDDNYRWEFVELFHMDNEISEDDLYEITVEVSMIIKEYYLDITDKYGLYMSGLHHNYKDAWREGG